MKFQKSRMKRGGSCGQQGERMKYSVLFLFALSTSALAQAPIKLGENKISAYSTSGGANPAIKDTRYKDPVGKNYLDYNVTRAPASPKVFSEQNERAEVSIRTLVN